MANSTIKYLMVFATVMITILTSLLLDHGSEKHALYSIGAVVIFGLAVFLNLMKFGLWAHIHSNYKLSRSYPITAVFFPSIYLIAIIQGETLFSLKKTIGVLIILCGLAIMDLNFNKK